LPGKLTKVAPRLIHKKAEAYFERALAVARQLKEAKKLLDQLAA
jgi:hypothetical protein